MSSAARSLIAGFSLLGLVASGAAAWIHFRLVENPDYSSFCDINQTISCKQAYLSAYGSIGGVPVALLGVFFFALMLMLLEASRRARRLAESAGAYIFGLSLLALIAVVYLAYASFFILKEVCPLCVLTYLAVVGTATVSGVTHRTRLAELPRRLTGDVGELLTSRTSLSVAAVFIVLAISTTILFPRPEVRPAVQPLPPLPANQRTELERWFDLQPKVELPYSAEGARVLIVKFNDYQCPPCRGTYFAYESVLEKYKERPNEVRFLLKHFPLNPKCNPAVTNSVHPAACEAAAAAEMARSTGAFDKLSDWFYLHQDELTPATVRRAAAQIAGIADFDARYAKALEQVRADATTGAKLGVTSTPTFFINGRKVPSLTPPALDALIEYELRRGSS